MSKTKNKTIDKDYPEKREKTQTNNVFDDVYKTICQKAPELLIPVINEAFGTKYKENASITQLRTEQHESYGIRNTDSVFKIEDHFYHIENLY